MKIIALGLMLSAAFWLLFPNPSDTTQDSQRGKIVLTGTSLNLTPEDGMIMFASLSGTGGALNDSIDVRSANVCELVDNRPTGRRFRIVGRKFPAGFRFAGDCDREGDIVLYQLITPSQSNVRVARIVGFIMRD